MSMNDRTVVSTPSAPGAIGPYSQAVIAPPLVFTAGQIPIVPATGQLAGDDIRSQTRQALTNVSEILRAAGASLDRVVKTTVFMKDLAEFQSMNEVYAEFFPSSPPARSTVEVARLPRDVRVEIEAIAIVNR